MKRILIPVLSALLATPALSAADYLDRSAWSWATSSECQAEEDITGLMGIYDGNTSTCWHSNYHAASGTPERTNPHWVMIDRRTDSSLVYGLAYVPRQSNGDNPATACTEYALFFSDRTFEGTTAASYDAIVSELGSPDVTGSWAGDATEKFVIFEKPVSARYILFVNISSNGSNSAACAEMNLLGKGGSGVVDPNNPGYNAIKIVTAAGDSHRIAIDGEQLAFSMADGNIRMGNSAITVEYAMDEVKYFKPEQYDFEAEEFYNGPKTDIYFQPVEVVLDIESLTLEEGQSAVLTATVTNAPDEAETIWSSSDETVATVDSHGKVTAVAPGTSIVTVACGDASAECRLTVTAKPIVPVEISITPESVTIEEGKTFRLTATVLNGSASDRIIWNCSDMAVVTVDADGLLTAVAPGTAVVTAQCGDASAQCDITVTAAPHQGEDGIDAPSTPTLTLRREGESLVVGGITAGRVVALFSLGGVKVSEAPVSDDGTAVLTVGSLPRTTYLLSVSGLTLKITL